MSISRKGSRSISPQKWHRYHDPVFLGLIPVAWEGLNHVYFISPNDGWGVGWGDGILLHYSDGAWVQVKSEALSPGSELNSVHFISSNEGWAVGWILDNKGLYRGLTLHYFNGVWNSVYITKRLSDRFIGGR